MENLFHVEDGALVSCTVYHPDVTVPEGTTEIHRGAFGESGLRSISLPKSLRLVEKGAFRGCQHLADVTAAAGFRLSLAGVFSGTVRIHVDGEDC